MTVKYCPNCGNKANSSVALNFCSKCGTSLNSTSKARLKDIEGVEETDGDTEYEVLDLSKIKEGIRITAHVEGSTVVKIEDVLKEAKANGPSQKDTFKRPIMKIEKGQKLTDVIKKECASSRGNPQEVT